MGFIISLQYYFHKSKILFRSLNKKSSILHKTTNSVDNRKVDHYKLGHKWVGCLAILWQHNYLAGQIIVTSGFMGIEMCIQPESRAIYFMESNGT